MTKHQRILLASLCLIGVGLGACDDADDDGGPSCEQSTFSSGPGFEECFECLEAMCCAELQNCGADEDCTYCAGTPTDTICVDPTTFVYYPLHQAMIDCMTTSCDLQCQGFVPSDCVPGDCAASCVNYDTGCA